jgi:hypothetical protein
MLSPVPSQQLLLSELASNDLTQDSLGPLWLDSKTRESARSKTNGKINVSCVNCAFEEKRDWQGLIIGRGIHGSFNAIFTRIKYGNKLLKGTRRLIDLLTVCDGCCIELDWDGKPDRDHILSVGDVKKISASLVLSLSYKEVGQVISSQAIVMEGQLMNTIKTISMDGQEKEWFLLNKPKSILEI